MFLLYNAAYVTDSTKTPLEGTSIQRRSQKADELFGIPWKEHYEDESLFWAD